MAFYGSNLQEIRRDAREYPGSYRIIEDGRMNGVSFIRYQNPNNVTDTEYIAWKRGYNEGSCNCRSHSITKDVLKYEGVFDKK